MKDSNKAETLAAVFVITLMASVVALIVVGCGSSSTSTPVSSGTSVGPETYVADLAGTTADDVTCENAAEAGTGSGYFCGVSGTYSGEKDYNNPPTCYHVFSEGAGWSAYSGDEVMEAPLFCPSDWGWGTIG